jgi:hypothetical protein
MRIGPVLLSSSQDWAEAELCGGAMVATWKNFLLE